MNFPLCHIFRILNRHPLNKGRTLEAFLRYMKWQIGSRIIPGDVVYHWVNETLVIVKPGEWGFTQNIYCGLQEFEDMAYVLHVIQSEDLFVDIGANIGSFTLLACAVKGARGICFEPVPSTYKRLLNNLRINDLSGRVKAHNIGVADKEGYLLFTSGLNTANHVVAEDEHISNPIKVKVLPLDDVLVDDLPSVIKIDVEGLESLVLKGMSQILSNPILHSIIIELNDSGERYGFRDLEIIKTIQAYGFNMYTYEPFTRKLLLLQDKNTPTRNVLFLRNIEHITERLIKAPSIVINKVKI